MNQIMDSTFIRELILHTICNVTGELPESLMALDEIALDGRDWEQVISRIEATLDIETGILTSAERVFSLDVMTPFIYGRLAKHINSQLI